MALLLREQQCYISIISLKIRIVLLFSVFVVICCPVAYLINIPFNMSYDQDTKH